MGWHTVDHHGDGRVAAHHDYVGLYLDLGEVDWDEVRELITDA